MEADFEEMQVELKKANNLNALLRKEINNLTLN